MPHFNNYLIDNFISPVLIVFFFIGGVFAVIIALGLIFKSASILRLFDQLNHSVSMRTATKPLGILRNSSPFFFKHRMIVGVLFIVGALYADYGLLTGAGNAAIVSMLKLKASPGLVFWMVESVRYVLLVGCTVSIIIGVLLIASPETLRSIEKSGGHWVSTRKIAPRAENMDLSFDRWVSEFPRIAGWILVFPALGMAMYFGDLILKRQ